MKHTLTLGRSFVSTLLIASATLGASSAGALAQTPAATAPAPAASTPAPQERVAAIKKSFAESQARLRGYEWIETTVVELKGEEKSRKQNRCFYGAEGKVQKIALTAPPEEKPSRGIRGKIRESKREELADYMEAAATLLHQYLPPDPAKIQKSLDAGKASIHILEPGKRARIDFADYLVPGDVLSVEVDINNNTILGLTVASKLSESKDPVSLEVKFDKFPDGTIYQSKSTLDATAKKVKVVVENSGYTQTTQPGK
jgi:hypothetical protein